MSNLAATFENEVVIGNDYDVTRNIVGVPYGVTIIQAWLTIKQDIDDPDSRAIIQKIVTAVPVGGVGVVTDGSAVDLVASVLFQLTSADTSLLNRNTTYVYDIQLKTSSDKIYTDEWGYFTPKGQVTVSTA